MKHILVIVLCAALLLCLGACSGEAAKAPSPETQTTEGDTAPGTTSGEVPGASQGQETDPGASGEINPPTEPDPGENGDPTDPENPADPGTEPSEGDSSDIVDLPEIEF